MKKIKHKKFFQEKEQNKQNFAAAYLFKLFKI